MKKFRQFTKDKKKKLTAHELKHGVATHFEHGENRKKSLKEEKVHPSKYHLADDYGSQDKSNHELDPVGSIVDYGGYGPVQGHIKRVSSIAKAVADNHPYEPIYHKDAVNDYTGGSADTNMALYKHHTEGLTLPDHFQQHLNKLDSAVGYHKLKHDLTVYSGVTGRVPKDAATHPERKVYHPGYVSTSLSSRTAIQFAKPDSEGNQHVLRIHLKKGHSALPILHHSRFKNENEVIVPRGHTFKISDNPEIHHFKAEDTGDQKKLHIWDAHIHDGDEK